MGKWLFRLMVPVLIGVVQRKLMGGSGRHGGRVAPYGYGYGRRPSIWRLLLSRLLAR